jgi:hypothetical protein
MRRASSKASIQVTAAPRPTSRPSSNLHQGKLCQALRPQDAHHGGRSAQRPCAAVLRGAHVKLLRVLTEAANSAAIPNGTSTSRISRSRTSITRAPRPRVRRRMASVNASTRVVQSTNCSPIWTRGSKNTMKHGHIRDVGASAKRPCRPSWMQCR